MTEFASLELFVEVARCRSFSRAAERVGVSQSAVSQRMSQLEKAWGVKLLDRSSRPLGLTEAGRVLLEEGGPVVSAYRALAERVAGMAGPGVSEGEPASGGALRVRGIYSSGMDWLNAVTHRWEGGAGVEGVAGAAWQVAFASHEAVRDDLLHGRADLGVVSYPAGLADAWAQAGPAQRADEPPGRWAWVPLRDEPLALICPPGHRFTREPAVAARHLPREGLLLLDAKLPLGRAIADYLEEHAAHPVHPAPSTSAPTATMPPRRRPTAPANLAVADGGFDNLDTLKSAVVATGTPAILPRRCVADELQTGRLIAVTLRPAIARPLAVAWREPGVAAAGTPQAAALTRHASPPPHLADAVAFLQQHAHDAVHDPSHDRRATAAVMPFPQRLALPATA